MIRAGIIAVTTIVMSMVVAALMVFNTASAQTATPTVSPVPTTTVSPTPTGSVKGTSTVPSGAPATGMGGY